QLAYSLRGDEGPTPVLLIHGIGSTGQAWDPVVERLAATGHGTIAVDLPGHGRSGKTRDDYSLGALASLLRDLLDLLDVRSCVLVGHSLGGGIALQFCYQFPERVAALALISSGGLGVETSAVLKWTAVPGSGVVMATACNRVTIGAMAAVATGFNRLHRPLPAALTPSTLDRLREIADPDHRNAFLAILRAVVDQSGQKFSALPKMATLADTPTLIVWGSQDHILPMAHGVQAHALLPTSTNVVYEGAGHEPHEDDPERMSSLLTTLAGQVVSAPQLSAPA
ncbi:MAG: hypothetical protein QG671_2042, partial [Actinomycetota bacterium]|nr:hypothetical protein [Actinomycetota bacterium]